MKEQQRGDAPPGINLEQILYIIFRHKWKIVAISLLGALVVISLPKIRPVPYESEAKLYIRYVLETTAPSQSEKDDGRIKPMDTRGESIINTELEILTSRDLAQQVAVAIGPERLLGPGQGTNLDAAAYTIQKGLKAEVPRESSVIRLVFQNQDSRIVQDVLRQLVTSYFKKHAQIHAVGAFDDFLQQETDQLRSKLVVTEDELRKAKAKAGVISMEDAKASYSEELGRIQQQLLETQAELVERRAAVEEISKSSQTTAAVSTSGPPALATGPVPADKLNEYTRVCGLLEILRKREQELSTTFVSTNYLVRSLREQIAQNEETKQRLEAENPGLIAKAADAKAMLTGSVAGTKSDLISEMARVSALDAKVKVLTAQLEDIRKRAAALADQEGNITELQRLRDLEEAHYKKFSENLAQSQLDERLGAGKVSNISVIEEPTPPHKAKTKLLKIMAGLFLGSIAAAFGLPFLIELYLDQSIRRPAEVEAKLGLPLFLSIPLLRDGSEHASNGAPRALLAERNPGEGSSKDGVVSSEESAEIIQHSAAHPLQRYYEALRDRLITYFEMKGLIHKPKLVAVTSCTPGSGVSTTAAGLAASLSQIGDGNVLLVNMNLQNGAAHHFHRGKLALEEALENSKREGAFVQENLYVVNEHSTGDQLSPMLPKRFKQLVPRLKASDFDYIIFDLPPVSQISLTPRLARFMDAVLMVVEAEKTGREVVKKACALLAESNENIGVVLNKGRTYVPGWFKQDI